MFIYTILIKDLINPSKSSFNIFNKSFLLGLGKQQQQPLKVIT